MYKELPGLVMFCELGEDSIIKNLSSILCDFDKGDYDKTELTSRIYKEIHKLLEIGTDFGFDKNLWHDYIAYVLVTNENPFSLTAERMAPEGGSVNEFVLRDMMIFNHFFEYDFSRLEKSLGIDCFSVISNYKSIHKRRQLYNKNVSEKVRALSDAIYENLKSIRGGDGKSQGQMSPEEEKKAAEGTFTLIRDFYEKYGVGMFGLNTAFRISSDKGLRGYDEYPGEVTFSPINNTDRVMLDDLIGYEIQKQRLKSNTEAFINGSPANNVLLYGDAGTGKSTSIKALINEYYDKGLRMIELYKHQMRYLSPIISSIKNRNYRFIIYMDDLSFEENETEYKYLKAVIEGGLETRPDNVLIYATSNRRNLIRETWNDISDIEIDKHRSDTLQEKLSLVSRFGVSIPYMKPNKKEYEEIVSGLAERAGIEATKDEILAEANKWSVSHGGMSGRVAQQLIDSLT
ncbi:MAG: ATP-binding protein [Eubacterium sp.]|nr:ATP-binding protein [Eubacterium sp.]